MNSAKNSLPLKVVFDTNVYISAILTAGTPRAILSESFRREEIEVLVSEPILIEIRNDDLLRLYPPVLRVRGVRRTASQDYQDALQDSLEEEVRPPPETPQSLYQFQALLDR